MAVMKVQAAPKLYIIADLDHVGSAEALHQYLLQLGEAARRFVSQLAIQVRAKNATDEAFERIARAARRQVGGEALLVLNGSAKSAVAFGYDGVHWPQSRIPEQPTVSAAPAFRSAAVHSLTAIHQAERGQATALVYSPVFSPTWKSAQPTGLAALSEAARASRLPVYALGGITPDRIGACRAAGAYGVAVLSGLADSECPVNACARYLEKLG